MGRNSPCAVSRSPGCRHQHMWLAQAVASAQQRCSWLGTVSAKVHQPIVHDDSCAWAGPPQQLLAAVQAAFGGRRKAMLNLMHACATTPACDRTPPLLLAGAVTSRCGAAATRSRLAIMTITSACGGAQAQARVRATTAAAAGSPRALHVLAAASTCVAAGVRRQQLQPGSMLSAFYKTSPQ